MQDLMQANYDTFSGIYLGGTLSFDDAEFHYTSIPIGLVMKVCPLHYSLQTLLKLYTSWFVNPLDWIDGTLTLARQGQPLLLLCQPFHRPINTMKLLGNIP